MRADNDSASMTLPLTADGPCGAADHRLAQVEIHQNPWVRGVVAQREESALCVAEHGLRYFRKHVALDVSVVHHKRASYRHVVRIVAYRW